MPDKNLTFIQKIQKAGFLPNVLCGAVILIYSSFIINLNIINDWLFCLYVVAAILIAQVLLSPISNLLIMKKISELITEWESGKSTVEQRTKLFKKIHKIPRYKQISTFIYFFVISLGVAVGYHYYFELNIWINACSFTACAMGSYVASLLSLSYVRRICSQYEQTLVEEGLDEEIFSRQNFYGVSYNKAFVFYCIIPIIWSSFLFLMTFIVYYFNNVPGRIGYEAAGAFQGITSEQLQKLVIILVINIITGAVSVYSFLNSILISSGQLQRAMDNIINNDVFSVKLVPTDYENEVSYNIYLVNKVVLLFRSILDKIRAIGNTMNEPIQELAEISQSTAATSLEQSTGVREILATMEDTDVQTRGIVEKIGDVTSVAEGTAQNVETGFNTLESNLDKMNEITEANIATISGIRELGEKIGSIWEIVKIINDIAEQTRIIAFNAELEASSAGESGKNFHIVANEVRRLAAGITTSVDQIKDRITEIQHSSDNLIITSESGTEKIKEGLDLSEKLKEKFTEIRKSSEITVESTLQIKDIIYQQSAAFDQIVSTVRQIAAGTENFSTSTNTINETAKKLKDAADKLENLHLLIIKDN